MKKVGTKKVSALLISALAIIVVIAILIMTKMQNSIAAVPASSVLVAKTGTIGIMADSVTGSTFNGVTYRIPIKEEKAFCYNTFCMRKGAKLKKYVTGYTSTNLYDVTFKNKDGKDTTSAVQWILDNIYLDYDGGEVYSNTGITPNVDELEYYNQNLTDIVCIYYSDNAKEYNRSDVYSKISNLNEGVKFRAQQIAIWYFVNSPDIAKGLASTGLTKGIDRDIYDALVSIANKKLDEGYVSPNKTGNKPTINSNAAKLNTANSLIGPFTINNNSYLFKKEVTINLTTNTGNSYEKSYTIVNNEKKEIVNFNGNLESTNVYNGEFYIKLNDCELIFNNENINLEVDVEFDIKGYTTEGKYWEKKNESGYQPLASLKRSSVKTINTFSYTKNATDLDLALKKTIVNVKKSSGQNIQYDRLDIDEIDTTTLDNGEYNALYPMKKSPVEVEVGDIVTFEIKVFNESTKIDAAAIEIVDYLPDGLVLAEDETDCVTANEGKIEYTYNKDKKYIKITYINPEGKSNPGIINKYDGKTLSSRSVFVKCKVVDTKVDVITNVAEITKYGYINTNNSYRTVQYGQPTSQYINDRDSAIANWESPIGSDAEYKLAVLSGQQEIDLSRDTQNWSEYSNNQQEWVNDDEFHNFIGQQDDDDFEKLIIIKSEPDVALKKFIVSVKNDTDGETFHEQVSAYSEERLLTVIPQPGIKMDNNAKYFMTKIPVEVKVGDTVTYAIRIFNEGKVEISASEVIDYLPNGLKFSKAYLQLEKNSDILELTGTEQDSIPGKVEYNEDSNMVKLSYSGDLLDAYSENSVNLDYYTFYVECEVESGANGILTNVAEISKYKLENGEIEKDIDSTPNNWKIGNLDKTNSKYRTDELWINYSNNKDCFVDGAWEGQEDDDDFEKVYVNEYMDLALRKTITSVIKKDGTQIDYDNEYSNIYDENQDTRIYKRKITITEPSWENFNSSLENTTLEYYHAKDAVTVEKGDKVIYTIKIYNEGNIAGKVIKVGDYLPEGMKLAENSQINNQYGWSYTIGYGLEDLIDNKFIAIETTLTEDNIIDAMDQENTIVDSISLEIELEVMDNATPNRYITNIAEIKDAVAVDNNGNELSDIEDRDSTPNTIFEDLDDMKDEEISEYFEYYYAGYFYTGVEDYGESYYPGQQDDDDFETVYLYQEINNTYNLKVIKVNSVTKEAINGVKFNITGKKAETENYIVVDNVELNNREYVTADSTNSIEFNNKTYTSGIVEINNIKVDELSNDIYTFKEIEVPTGKSYKKINGEFQIRFESDTIGNVKPVEVIDATTDAEIETYINSETNTVIVLIPNEPTGKYSLDIVKEDENGIQITNGVVEFKITYPNKTSKRISSNNGKIDIVSDLPITEVGVDEYIVQETVAPTGYAPNTQTIYIRVEKYYDEESASYKTRIYENKVIDNSENEYSYISDPNSLHTIKIPNTSYTGEYKIRIKKIDLENPDKVLEGVEFTILTSKGANKVTTGEDGYTQPITVPIENNKYSNVYSVDTLQITEDSLGKYEGLYNKVIETIPVYIYKGIVDGKYEATDISLQEGKINKYRVVELDNGYFTYVGASLNDNTITLTVRNKEIKVPDLALEKFITAVTTKDKTTEITDREPVFHKDKTVTNDDGYIYTPKYEDLKPLEVNYNDIITYTLRIYNEGEIDAYAAEIIDDIPEGIEFVPYTAGDGSINDTYRWVMYKIVTQEEISKLPAGTEVKQLNGVTKNGITVYDTCVVTTNVAEADYVVTDYLSKEQGEARVDIATQQNPNLLEAFEPTNAQKLEDGPDYRDIKIQFKVTHAPTTKVEADNIIVNSAQITRETDKTGNNTPDRDSTPNVWTDDEDDQDKEKIKVNYFDLALVKWVSDAIIIEDGVEKVEKGNNLEDLQNQYDHRLIYAMYPENIGEYTDLEPVVKVDIPESKIENIVVKFKYKIKVSNEGQIDGYVKEITDYIPEGLKFIQEDNPLWKDVGNGKVVTNQLADKLLTVGGEPETVEIIYTWINSKDNIGLKVNMAEISQDYNESETPDVDSTPNNITVNEDDIDDAPVLVSVRTGEALTSDYIILGVAVVLLIATGIVLIKKFVI